MAKKRLSDLLREEVNKSADEAGQSTEPSSEPANESAKQPAKSAKSSAKPSASSQPPAAVDTNETQGSTQESAQSSPEAKPAAPQGEPLRLGVHPNQQPQQDKASNPVSTQRKDSTQAELESTIAELKAQLQTAQQQKETFEQQVDRLQAEVKQQQSTIEQLQTEVQHSKSLKAELEEARQVILKLSEINAKPVDAKYTSQSTVSQSTASQSTASQSTASQSTASQSTSQSAPQATTRSDNNGAAPLATHHHYVKAGESKEIPQPTTSRSGAPIVPAPSNAAEPELESKPVHLKMPGSSADSGKLAPPQPSRHQQELRRILDHPIRPGSLPPMPTPEKEKEDKKLSETDMGWVD